MTNESIVLNMYYIPYTQFLIEKTAKNKAYYFIISHGLMDEFVEFCESCNSVDFHKDCVDLLLSNAQNQTAHYE